MNNNFVGDAGDFGKYGLLRWLIYGEETDHKKFRLGINWYLSNKNNGPNAKAFNYLNKPEKYRNCDSELFDFLRRIFIGELPRSITPIENSHIFPPNTLYYSDIVTSNRSIWIKNAIACLSGADLIFLDPDNGLDPKNGLKLENIPKNRKKVKHIHIYYDEIKLFIEQKQTLIIYQHNSHPIGGFDKFLKDQMSYFKEKCNSEIAAPFSCIFSLYQARAFIIIPIGSAGVEVVARARNMMKDKNWKNLFREVI